VNLRVQVPAAVPDDEPRAGHLRGQRLYLFRLDRLTRTGIADTLTTLEELRAHGVEVVSVADGLDLTCPHAEIIIAVMAWPQRWRGWPSESASRRPGRGSRLREAVGVVLEV
jgi:hypothetical protein